MNPSPPHKSELLRQICQVARHKEYSLHLSGPSVGPPRWLVATAEPPLSVFAHHGASVLDWAW